jgi:hypothetical protein
MGPSNEHKEPDWTDGLGATEYDMLAPMQMYRLCYTGPTPEQKEAWKTNCDRLVNYLSEPEISPEVFKALDEAMDTYWQGHERYVLGWISSLYKDGKDE